MGKIELKLPQMGESIEEATLIAWKKEIGDIVRVDDILIEVATDKVDNQIPSEVEGKLVEKLFFEDQVIGVGKTYGILETKGSDAESIIKKKESPIPTATQKPKEDYKKETVSPPPPANKIKTDNPKEKSVSQKVESYSDNIKSFYSPLIRNIVQKEKISWDELQHVKGSGKNNRLTKEDVLNYVKHKNNIDNLGTTTVNQQKATKLKLGIEVEKGDKVIEMDRVRKLIAQHMTDSLKTSAHVQSVVEADVTNVVRWREKVKIHFQKETGTKLTFTPILIEAIVYALREYPLLNSHIEGYKIIVKKDINIGMATALANGNLIVPVIKNAEDLNLVGLAKKVNALSQKARDNKLTYEETKGGTYTVSNVGNFKTLIGTPIINQPQVGIIALGAIQKVPAVMESEQGDFITIRHKMYLTHSYDHRVIDGAIGGMFAGKVAEYLEQWDEKQSF